jgi:hypothetical protein
MYALKSFRHFDLVVASGDELPDDHPMVVARPDLFTDKPPKRSRAKKEQPS